MKPFAKAASLAAVFLAPLSLSGCAVMRTDYQINTEATGNDRGKPALSFLREDLKMNPAYERILADRSNIYVYTGQSPYNLDITPGIFTDEMHKNTPLSDCKIFSHTREEDIPENMDTLFGFAVENKKIDREDIQAWAFFHEVAHCVYGELPGDMDEGLADLFAINAIEAVDPSSNIDQVVMAYRLLHFDENHVSSLLLQKVFAGDQDYATQQTINTELKVREIADSYIFYDYNKFYADVFKREYEHLDIQGIGIMTKMVSLYKNVNTPGMNADVSNYIQMQVDAYEFLIPTKAAKAKALSHQL